MPFIAGRQSLIVSHQFPRQRWCISSDLYQIRIDQGLCSRRENISFINKKESFQVTSEFVSPLVAGMQEQLLSVSHTQNQQEKLPMRGSQR